MPPVSLEPVVGLARPTRVKASALFGLVLLGAGVAACGTRAYGQPPGSPAGGSATAIPAQTASASPWGSVSASGPATIPPRASSPPAATAPGALTAVDNGATVRLHPGQRVTIALAARGMFSWHVPAATGAAVMKISGSGGYPGKQPARAVFRAVGPGRATLSAVDDAACLHAQPACLLSQQAWQVTVIVTPFIPPADGGPATPLGGLASGCSVAIPPRSLRPVC